PAPADATAAASYGLFWGDDSRLKDLPARLAATIEEMTASVSTALQAMFHDVSSIHVETYTSKTLADVAYDRESRRLTGPANLRVLSHIDATGDTMTCLPDNAG